MCQIYIMKNIKALIEKAKTMTNSGHPHLDRRWTSEGPDGRNKHYRRPYYRFCMELARAIKPNVVVELGIDESDCSGHFAFGCPTAAVYGVDVHKDGEEPSLRCRETEKQFPNFKYLRGWTWDKLETLKSLNITIDILFIDSWHEYDYFAKDWNDYTQLITNKSIILVDDLHMTGIGNAFNKIPGNKYIDKSMNPAVPFGILLEPDVGFRFEHKKMEYMP